MGRPMLPSPTTATAAGGRTLVSSGNARLLERLARQAEVLDPGRHAAVDRDLQQNLGDLLLGDAVLDRALHVRLELVMTVERREHGEVEHAARAPVEARPIPDRTPAIFGDEVLHRPVEVVGRGDLLVDIVGAEHLAAHFEPAVVHVGHGVSFLLSAIGKGTIATIVIASEATRSRGDARGPWIASSAFGLLAMTYPIRTSAPPSTGKATPVMKFASSEARNSAALATSQAVPMRLRSGTLASRMAATSARLLPMARARVSTAIGVSIRPGRMTLARTPYSAFWMAICLVKATIAALVAL